MKIEVAQHARMSERGSSLLRLIQNNDMPLLDLLIRESVQNSLDAGTLNNSNPVQLSYNIKEFQSLELNHELEGIEEKLNSRFLPGKYKMLEIKDSNTTGLTGPIHYSEVVDDDFGNLLKLVYEISMPQQTEGAGGSWGLGKTVYFRVGIGLVFYYSRVKDEHGHYSSRLAACLVEDERREDALLGSNDGKLERGIAWWGQQADEHSTKPLTDENEISKILSIFGVEEYSEDDTGTTIIIPYIDTDKLLEGIIPTHDDEDRNNIHMPWWVYSVEEYLRVALQRWYSPRLSNPNYPYGKWLNASVNGRSITTDEMLPLFRVIQALYNRTEIADVKGSFNDILDDCEHFLCKVSLRNMFENDGCAGWISFVKMSKEQLKMCSPDNQLSPFVQAQKFDADESNKSPILMYVRKPGMIVSYETTGRWTDGIPRTGSDEYIIALFIADSSKTLKKTGVSLDEYIRKGEKADHTSWTDWSDGSFAPLIISKVQKSVRNNISKHYVQSEPKPETRKNVGLGRVLAQLLLPPENFGNKANSGKGGMIGGAVSSAKGHGTLKLEAPRYSNGMVLVDFEMKCGNKNNVFEIQLQVLSESGKLDAEKWEIEEIIGRRFPISLDKVIISKIQVGRKLVLSKTDAMIVTSSQITNTIHGIEFKIKRTTRFDIPFCVQIKAPTKEGYSFNGTVIFSGYDDMVQGGLAFVQSEGDKE